MARGIDTTTQTLPGTRRATPIGWAVRRWRDPWRPPRWLAAFTWLYLAWSILPVGIAMLFSFNSGRSRSAWQGFSWRWYFEDPTDSVLHDPTLHAALIQSLKLAGIATLVTIPLGVLFAIGIDRWRGRAATSLNFLMLLSFVIPELILGVALLFVFANLFDFVHLGTGAQLLGLITFEISYPVIIVRARMLSMGKDLEEAAMDLGAPPSHALRRVLLPMIYPAIFASAVLVFASVIDDFIIVRYLSLGASTEPMSVAIYNTARASPTPALNALATIMVVVSFVAAILGLVTYRWLTKGERARDGGAATQFAAQI